MEPLNYSGSMGLNRLEQEETIFLLSLRQRIRPFLDDPVLIKRSESCALYVAELLQYIDAPVFPSVIAGHLFEIGRKSSTERNGHLYREFLSQENRRSAETVFSELVFDSAVLDDVLRLISSVHRHDPFDCPEMRILRDAMRLLDRTEFLSDDAERTRAKLSNQMETEAGFRLICQLLKLNTSVIS